MSVSLKDLRKLSSDIDNKKREVVEGEKRKQVEEQTQLKAESLKRATYLKEQAEAEAKKSRRLRQTFILIGLGILFLAVAVAFRVMMDGWSGRSKVATHLASEGLTPINATDPEYKEALDFVNNIISSFEKSPDAKIPFYNALPYDRQVDFKNNLTHALETKGWNAARVSQDERTGIVRVAFQANNEALTFDLTNDENGALKVVKIY